MAGVQGERAVNWDQLPCLNCRDNTGRLRPAPGYRWWKAGGVVQGACRCNVGRWVGGPAPPPGLGLSRGWSGCNRGGQLVGPGRLSGLAALGQPINAGVVEDSASNNCRRSSAATLVVKDKESKGHAERTSSKQLLQAGIGNCVADGLANPMPARLPTRIKPSRLSVEGWPRAEVADKTCAADQGDDHQGGGHSLGHYR